MDKFYVYCSANQVYNALTYNSLVSSSLSIGCYRAATVCSLSENYLFITCDKIGKDKRKYGCSAENISVTLEISNLVADSINCFLANDDYTLSEGPVKLSDYYENEDCRGAFVFGRIPASAVKSIIFENDADRSSFMIGAPELWFPENMFKTWEDKEYKAIRVRSFDIDKFVALSNAVDSLISENEAAHMNRLINIFLKKKAAAYYFIDGTKDWSMCNGNLLGNIDNALITFLDNDNNAFMENGKQILDKYSFFSFINQNALDEKDSVFSDSSSSGHLQLINVIDSLSKKESLNNALDDDGFLELCNLCRVQDGNLLETDDLSRAIDLTQDFYINPMSELSIDELFKQIDKYPVLKSLLIFARSSTDYENFEVGCSKLKQEEKRYALCMFGAYNGMMKVDGTAKDNLKLDSLIENRLSSGLKTEQNLIITSTCEEKIPASETELYYHPFIKLMKSKTKINEYIQTVEDDEILQRLYEALLKDLIPLEDVSLYDVTVILRLMKDGRELRKVEIRQPKKIEISFKKAAEYLKDRPLQFSGKLFKEALRSNTNLMDVIYSHYCSRK